MKLNKLQRYTAYCIMLAEIEYEAKISTKFMYKGFERTSTENGFCWLYKMLFDLDFNYDFEPVLPELNKYEKSDWWSNHPVDWDIRKEALKQCIIETHP